MRNLRHKLKGVTGKKEKTRIIKASFESEAEKLHYSGLYKIFTAELKKTRHVSKAASNLHCAEHTHFNELHEFSLEYQAACVAAGKPLRTPSEYIKEVKKANPKTNGNRQRLSAIEERYQMRYSKSKNLDDGTH